MMLMNSTTVMAISVGQTMAANAGVGTKIACSTNSMIAATMTNKNIGEKEIDKTQEIKDEKQYGVFKISKYDVKIVPNPEAQIKNLAKLTVDSSNNFEYRSPVLKSICSNILKGRL